MQKLTVILLAVLTVGITLVWTAQRKALRNSQDRLNSLEAQLAGLPAASDGPGGAPPAAAPRGSAERADLSRRVGDLEQSVAQLTRALESLMERGQLALSTNKMDELQQRALDAAVADKERLQALRLLRRNKGLSDEVVQGALAWLQSTTNAETRREILQQLDGATNGPVRQSLLALAAADADPRVRAEAVENLRRLAGEADVERSLWNLAHNDPDPRVREKAQEALREGPMTPDRAARLQQRINDANASVDDRLLAMRALVRAGTDVSGATAALTQLAQNTADPLTRARVFEAFDGGRDPGMLSPLVGGLQDADPRVRKAAADALGGFASDPRVRQWLEFVAQSDADTRVRREAQQALRELQQRR